MAENIITIDPNRKEGKIDLSLMEEFVSYMDNYTELCSLMLQAASELLPQTIEDLGLSHIDFNVEDMEPFVEDMEDPGGCSPSICIAGEDENYLYELSLTAYFPEDGEKNGTTLYTEASRYGDDNIEEMYNFDVGAWEKLNPEKEYNLTKKQIQTIEESSPYDTTEKDILIYHAENFGLLSDSEFEKLKQRNEAIINLSKATSSFTCLSFTDRKGEYLGILMYDQPGARVICREGHYILQIFLNEAVIADVYQTRSIDAVKRVITMMFDHAAKEDVLAVVPLSDSAYVTFRNTGVISTGLISPRKPAVLYPKELNLLKRVSQILFP